MSLCLFARAHAVLTCFCAHTTCSLTNLEQRLEKQLHQQQEAGAALTAMETRMLLMKKSYEAVTSKRKRRVEMDGGSDKKRCTTTDSVDPEAGSPQALFTATQICRKIEKQPRRGVVHAGISRRRRCVRGT